MDELYEEKYATTEDIGNLFYNGSEPEIDINSTKEEIDKYVKELYDQFTEALDYIFDIDDIDAVVAGYLENLNRKIGHRLGDNFKYNFHKVGGEYTFLFDGDLIKVYKNDELEIELSQKIMDDYDGSYILDHEKNIVVEPCEYLFNNNFIEKYITVWYGNKYKIFNFWKFGNNYYLRSVTGNELYTDDSGIFYEAEAVYRIDGEPYELKFNTRKYLKLKNF